jgi:hypothetical protein
MLHLRMSQTVRERENVVGLRVVLMKAQRILAAGFA